MANITLATLGSLGDLHPKIALGLELKRRGHVVRVATMEIYRERIEPLGFEFRPLRPDIDINDREFARELLDTRTGPEKLMRELILPALPDMYQDLMAAVNGSDVLVTGEIVYAAKSVVEKTGIKWISTSLAPLSLFSSHDPNVYPTAEWLEYIRPLPAFFHETLFGLMKWTISHWFDPYREFRRTLGLNPDHDPVFFGKFSDLLHLVMFSRVMSPPQPDWPRSAIQTGFCFYDGGTETMPEGLRDFLDAGPPPIVFTLGSAAVMDARDFFEQSAEAARRSNRRAVLLYGVFNAPPAGLDENVVAFDYAPYSEIFPKAACVVHQGGIGTTAQVLRAGVPHLIMPFGHDQPDNAVRCRRLGVAEVIRRCDYDPTSATAALEKILGSDLYSKRAREISEIVRSESGTAAACDAIEEVLSSKSAA